MRRVGRASLALCALVAPAWAQFEVRTVDGNGERAAPPVCDLGAIYPGEAISAAFRVRNVSTGPATLDFLEAAGTGFQLTPSARLPVSLAPQGALDFTVHFEASAPGSYSAGLSGDGISAILLATVLPRLTYMVDSAAGLVPVSGVVDFGTVERGDVKIRRFMIENQMALAMTVPAIAAEGAGFALSGTSPGGVMLRPGEMVEFALEFRPGQDVPAGARSGSLAIGDRRYPLTATLTEPPPPAPRLTIELAQTRSAQQGVATVNFDAPARAAGSGTLTMEFRADAAGAADPTILFASGGRTAAFSFGPGDTQARFAGQPGAAFQTGTTAGTLVFNTRLGGNTERRTIAILPAPVSVTSAEAVRQTGGIEVRIAGFDNTRTAGMLAFTFFDAAGNALAPGLIRTDASAAFAGYFPSSALGGAFLLKAVFPVTGNAAQIRSFTAEISNAAGAASTPKTGF